MSNAKNPSLEIPNRTLWFWTTNQGEKIWTILNSKISIESMQNTSDKGDAALLATEDNLIELGIQRLTLLSPVEKAEWDKKKQAIGRWICVIMEKSGYEKVTYIGKNGKVTDKKKILKNSKIFKTGQLYSVISTGTKNF